MGQIGERGMNTVRETVEHILGTLPQDSMAFYNEDGLGAVVVHWDDSGRAYVIDVAEDGSTQSAWTEELETGWTA